MTSELRNPEYYRGAKIYGGERRRYGGAGISSPLTMSFAEHFPLSSKCEDARL